MGGCRGVWEGEANVPSPWTEAAVFGAGHGRARAGCSGALIVCFGGMPCSGPAAGLLQRPPQRRRGGEPVGLRSWSCAGVHSVGSPCLARRGVGWRPSSIHATISLHPAASPPGQPHRPHCCLAGLLAAGPPADASGGRRRGLCHRAARHLWWVGGGGRKGGSSLCRLPAAPPGAWRLPTAAQAETDALLGRRHPGFCVGGACSPPAARV